MMSLPLRVPKRRRRHFLPLALSLIALILTFSASWSCTFFHGFSFPWQGSFYGLWTVQSLEGNCVLWDTLYYGSSIDTQMVIARMASMASMVLGLAVIVVQCFAVGSHAVLYSVGFSMAFLWLMSVTNTQVYNIWLAFFILVYVLIILVVRGVRHYCTPDWLDLARFKPAVTAWLIGLGVTMLLTIVALNSTFCRHSCQLTPQAVGDVGSAILQQHIDEECNNSVCRLHAAGYCAVFAAVAWFFAGISFFKTSRHERVMVVDTDETAETESDESNSCVLQDDDDINTEMQSVAIVKVVAENNDSMSERLRSCCSKFLFGVVFVLFCINMIIICGAKHEERHVMLHSKTTSNFVTDTVCAFAGQDFKTFDSPHEARLANYTVAHCGECGHCSNMHDIEVYVKTRETIANTAMKCSPKAVLASEHVLTECLEHKIGFSPQCNKCWVDDMRCDTRHCLFTCLKSIATGTKRNNNLGSSPPDTDTGGARNGWMNWCLQCDETMCGTDFVTCSGVARRRLGIESEIAREDKEQCPHVEVDWTTYFD